MQFRILKIAWQFNKLGLLRSIDIFTKYKIIDKRVWLVTLVSICLTYVIANSGAYYMYFTENVANLAEAEKLAQSAKSLDELKAAMVAFEGCSLQKSATNMVSTARCKSTVSSIPYSIDNFNKSAINLVPMLQCYSTVSWIPDFYCRFYDTTLIISIQSIKKFILKKR